MQYHLTTIVILLFLCGSSFGRSIQGQGNYPTQYHGSIPDRNNLDLERHASVHWKNRFLQNEFHADPSYRHSVPETLKYPTLHYESLQGEISNKLFQGQAMPVFKRYPTTYHKHLDRPNYIFQSPDEELNRQSMAKIGDLRVRAVPLDISIGGTHGDFVVKPHTKKKVLPIYYIPHLFNIG